MKPAPRLPQVRAPGWRFAVVAALPLIAAGAFWQTSKKTPAPPKSVLRGTEAPAPPVSSAPTDGRIAPEPPEEETAVVEHAPQLAVELRDLPWEAQIHAIQDARLPDPQKARLLLQSLPHVPGEGQAPLAEAAVRLLTDSAYAIVALPALLDPRTHGAAESVLFADLLERRDTVALPALLRLMRIPGHPFATSARETLALLVGRDHGEDAGAWARAVETQLALPE